MMRRGIGHIAFLAAFLLSACSRPEPVTGVPVVMTPVPLQLMASYPIGAFAAEPSGIAYDAMSDAFVVVSDSHPYVYVMDRKGNLIRSILTTSTDLEGVAVSGTGDTIMIAEERNRIVSFYNRGGTKLGSVTADVATLPNNGLEGVATMPNGELLVLNEKSPGMILRFSSGGTELSRHTLSFASDYSDLTYHDGSLWIISDESKTVSRTDLNGNKTAQWSLPFTKGEGIAIVRDTMYIVNDADATLYLFALPK